MQVSKLSFFVQQSDNEVISS